MKRKKKRKRLIIYLFILVIVVFITEYYVSNNLIRVTKIAIAKKNIPKAFNGFKIVQISDLHDKIFDQNNSIIVKKIKRESPDIIVMTGDMINGSDSDLKVLKSLCQELTKICKVYFVAGNHEQTLSTTFTYRLKKVLKETKVVFLNNEKVTITRENEGINLYGLCTSLYYYRDLSNSYSSEIKLPVKEINNNLGEANKNQFNILLTHNPVYFDKYSEWGADLTLSGHMHGGLVRIPFVGGVLSPERELFPKYDAGLYKDNNNYLYVNRGLSAGSVGFRMFNIPEITILTLKSE